MSNLPDIMDDFNNPRIHMARKWLAECKLAMWCLHQNLKGIAVPTALAIDQYMSVWGMGPHVEKVSFHLNQLSQKKRRANWMQHFKKFGILICRFVVELVPWQQLRLQRRLATSRTLNPIPNRKKNKLCDVFGFGLEPQFWNHFWFPKLEPTFGFPACFNM